MRLRFILACAAVGLMLGAAAEASVLRVVVVEASDAAAYTKALEQGLRKIISDSIYEELKP